MLWGEAHHRPFPQLPEVQDRLLDLCEAWGLHPRLRQLAQRVRTRQAPLSRHMALRVEVLRERAEGALRPH
mgnify:FL=1